jgi:putative nucleotidyltransferase with HDIG domain
MEVTRHVAHALGRPDPARLIARAQQFEPLPASTGRLSALLCQDDWMVRDVEEVVRQDLGLTSRILRRANAAWTAHLPSVATLWDAIMRIGVGTVLSLAVTDNVRPRLEGPLRAFGLQPGRLWQHAVASALAAEIIMRRTAADVRPEAVTAALLHDVGKVLLDEAIDEGMLVELRTAWSRGVVPRLDAERDVLGIDHAALGALVAGQWGLPAAVVDAVAWHHAPSTCPTPTGDAVHLANGLAKLAGYGPMIAELDGPIERDALARLGLDAGDIHGLCGELNRRMQIGQDASS